MAVVASELYQFVEGVLNIVDRRPNPQGKSLPNRQRFIGRAKAQVREAVARSIANRKISDVSSGQAAQDKVRISGGGTAEPFLRHSAGNVRDTVMPGNREFVSGDTIPVNRGKDGGGAGGASNSGNGEDAFEFTLSKEEFLDIFFEDLELPDLLKRQIGEVSKTRPKRAGFTVSGSPSAMSISRTMRNGLGRRIAMRRPGTAHVQALKDAVEAAVASGDEEALALARDELDEAVRQVGRVPFIDAIDVRYNRHEQVPQPCVNAVMFCLMDVSGSMTEHMKDMAKRFFVLLHLFLERRYEKVELVFIRHTHEASEVDEDTFFRSRETGGTVVSSAFEVMLGCMEKRFPPSDWNVYVAQAGDGDNFDTDNEYTIKLLSERVLPAVRYMAYIETSQETGHWGRSGESSLWTAYEGMEAVDGRKPAMRKVSNASQIWGVFSDLFSRNASAS